MVIAIQVMVEAKLNHHHSTKILSKTVVVLRAERVIKAEHAQEQLLRVVRVGGLLGKAVQMMI